MQSKLKNVEQLKENNSQKESTNNYIDLKKNSCLYIKKKLIFF